MPLDPQVQVLLDQLAAVGGPPLDELEPAQARELYRAFAAASVGEEVEAVEDRSIPGPVVELVVRTYRPAGAGDPAPVVVWYHGGGFTIGDLETHDATARAFANRSRCVVVAVDYRLAPEHPFPAAADDAFAALRWVVDHADELRADPARVAVAGDSAGGNLAAVSALRARDEGGPAVRFQLLVYPELDLTMSSPSIEENGEGYYLTKRAIDWFTTKYLGDGDPKDPGCSPLFAADLSGLPPAMVITAEFDPLRDEGEAYAARLGEAGVPVELVRYDGQIHGFFSMLGLVDGATEAHERAGAAVRAALG